VKGNRPNDVCALCDRAIENAYGGGYASLHLYLGPGWVHGGGRECIAIHHGCGELSELPEDAPHYGDIIRAIGFTG
jgi:hypothetical protein